MAFEKAERTNLYLRCALFGPSGSGKTMTALRMAKGIAEKMGVPYAVIDTEARSASKYADRFHFIVDNLESKTIDDYLKSMEEAKKAGYKVLVIDSLTHAWWELTDEKDRIAQSSTNKNALSPWAKLNPKQKRFIYAILNYPGHIIATMRSKTEWIIGEGKNGKTAPEKIGLAPEQGKGIEFEFDLLVELTQRHEGTVTKDRTGKFQDETIEKPGEEFGVALYDWLSSGKAVIPKTPAVKTPVVKAPVAKIPAKPQKAVTPPVTAKPDKPPAKETSLKEQGNGIIKEIGTIITTAKNGSPYFSEDEKEGAREIIKTTSLNEKGITDLKEFKIFLSNELAKRETQKAA